jgi:hypothetical protein
MPRHWRVVQPVERIAVVQARLSMRRYTGVNGHFSRIKGSITGQGVLGPNGPILTSVGEPRTDSWMKQEQAKQMS